MQPVLLTQPAAVLGRSSPDIGFRQKRSKRLLSVCFQSASPKPEKQRPQWSLATMFVLLAGSAWFLNLGLQWHREREHQAALRELADAESELERVRDEEWRFMAQRFGVDGWGIMPQVAMTKTIEPEGTNTHAPATSRNFYYPCYAIVGGQKIRYPFQGDYRWLEVQLNFKPLRLRDSAKAMLADPKKQQQVLTYFQTTFAKAVFDPAFTFHSVLPAKGAHQQSYDRVSQTPTDKIPVLDLGNGERYRVTIIGQSCGNTTELPRDAITQDAQYANGQYFP